jgi:hypothetical protein
MALSFGYNQGLPEGVRAAWGCRLIVTQTGGTDFVANRQGFYDGERSADGVAAWINSPVNPAAMGDKPVFGYALEVISELLRSYEMNTREAGEFTIYEDERGVIKANTNGSAGYCYVCAWLREDEAVSA